MVLELAPDSPPVVVAAAALVLALHITAAGVGLASGALALIFRKGSPLHRRAGDWFLVSMLVMAGIGAAVAPFLPQRGSAVAGAFTLYLVVTGWMTMRRRPGEIGRFESFALLCAGAVVGLDVFFGWQAATSPSGELDGIPTAPHFVFAGVAALAGYGDLRMIRRGGLTGAARLARHLWRMCIGLFIATASFFLGQQQVFPAALQGSPLLFIPELALLAVMVYWLIRIRVGRRFRDSAAATS
jgi:uncharacterized membrane protein